MSGTYQYLSEIDCPNLLRRKDNFSSSTVDYDAATTTTTAATALLNKMDI
jgi:hypothetical protein